MTNRSNSRAMPKCCFYALAAFILTVLIAVPTVFGLSPEAASVKLNKTKVTLNVGKSYSLKLKNNKKTVKWSSSKKSVATVDSNGTVTAKKKGTATITAKVGKKTYKCKVTVKQPVTSVKLSKSSLTLTKKGKTYTLKATASPSNANNRAVIWKSSNKKVATVTSKGIVKAVGNGTCKITATAKDGSKVYSSCSVTVCISSKSGHSWDSGKVTTTATCTKAGVKTYTCKRCKTTKTVSIPATGSHSWDSGKITKAATCTEAGVKTYTCKTCGQTKTEAIAAIGTHTWDSGAVTTQPTCTANGVKTYTCTVCGKTKTEAVAALGHNLTETVTKAATCAAAGEKTISCSRCDYSTTEAIPITGEHTWDGGAVTTEPICSAEGVKTYTCTVCGTTKTEIIAATGDHQWDAGAVTLEPTCGAEGVKTYTCTVCGTTKTEAIAATGEHNWVEHAEEGHYEMVTIMVGSAQICKTCAKTYVYRDLLEKFGVTEAEVTAMGYEVADDAVEAAAYHGLTTDGCSGSYYSDNVPVNHQQYIVDKAAYTTCSVCGATK